MKIQTNTAANSALRSMQVNSQNAERSIERLSSGFRINRAADDAAGLAMANKLRSDGKALGQAQRNAAQANSMLQIADGATQTVASILNRMKELATAANSSNVGSERDKVQAEFTQLGQEIDRIVATTQYQGKTLVNGSFGNSISGGTYTTAAGVTAAGTSISSSTATGTYTFANATGSTSSITLSNGAGVSQTITGAAGVGTLNFTQFGITVKTGAGFTIDSGAGGALDGKTITVAATSAANFQVGSSGNYAAGTNTDVVSLSAIDLRLTQASGLNLNQSLAGGATYSTALSDVTSNGDANRAQILTNLDAAIGAVNTALGSLGAAQSRIDFASSNVATQLQNTQAAESTIRDADMAFEMTQFTKNNILSQAAQSMLSQANQGSQGILQLLRG